ncbi:MAG: 50S ribosomal protein L6 [Candidatus Micrarchaeia archaeon]
MANSKIAIQSVIVPPEVKLQLENGVFSASGAKGKVQKKLAMRGLEMSLKNGKVEIKGGLREATTASKHIINMIEGCKNGYSQKMKVIHAHFPMSLEIKGKTVVIKNFIGERKPRVANIAGDTKVDVKGADIVVSGPSKDDMTQTVANLRIATKIKVHDSRVFQDGIYPID